MAELVRALTQHFGLPGFRPPQDEIINAVLEGADVLAVLPTGAGKSLCYQLPAVLLPGTSVVISPLLALMNDQVAALKARGIAAAALNSQTNRDDARSTLRALDTGTLKLLYISPERFAADGFLRERLDRVQVPLIAVDEAHCVSEWGHDFRPDYRALAPLFAAWPDARRLALTATADPRTRDDIAGRLALRSPTRITTSCDRPEIALSVIPRSKDGSGQLVELIGARRGQAGIIYVNTRRAAEDIAAELAGRGLPAMGYHAGMDDNAKLSLEARFRESGGVMVATSAFGMGVDKADVRFVVHQALPDSMEAYYQQIGRAGRDRSPAEAILLYSVQDVLTWTRRAQDTEDPGLRRLKRHKLSMLQRYAEAGDCRRQALLAYFGESSGPCGRCDVCLDPPPRRDVTDPMRKLLSAVHHMGGRASAFDVADHLRGVPGRHDGKSTFGLGASIDRNSWLTLAEEAAARGWIHVDLDQFGNLSLTGASRPVLRGDIPVHLALARPKASRARKLAAPAQLPDFAQARLDRLKAWRSAQARTDSVPAYRIFSDKSLLAMAALPRLDRASLAGVSGVGPAKLEAYGAQLLDILRGND
jgi:ATP-dependent DNA helicase RecQ